MKGCWLFALFTGCSRVTARLYRLFCNLGNYTSRFIHLQWSISVTRKLIFQWIVEEVVVLSSVFLSWKRGSAEFEVFEGQIRFSSNSVQWTEDFVERAIGTDWIYVSGTEDFRRTCQWYRLDFRRTCQWYRLDLRRTCPKKTKNGCILRPPFCQSLFGDRCWNDTR